MSILVYTVVAIIFLVLFALAAGFSHFDGLTGDPTTEPKPPQKK